MLEPTPGYYRTESEYKFQPQEKNMFDGKQHLEFDWIVDTEFCFIGGIEIDLYFKINTPQTDLMFFFYKTDKEGSRHYYGDRSALKIINDTNIVKHVKIETSPMMDKLNIGEKIGIEITSNNFPSRARNTGNEFRSFYNDFKDAQITIIHSPEFQSSLTFKIE